MLVDKQHVLLEARVQVRLQPQLADHRVVVAVDVRVHAVHALEDLLHQRRKVLGERHADAAGHDGLVVDRALHPRHELLNVRGRGHLGGFLVVVIVLPKVLELVGGFHFGARLGGAEFGNGAVEEVDLVVEVDHVDSQPLILVFTFRQLHNLAQRAATQSGLGILAQLVRGVAALARRAGPELVARALVSVELASGRGRTDKGTYTVVRREAIVLIMMRGRGRLGRRSQEVKRSSHQARALIAIRLWNVYVVAALVRLPRAP